MQCPKCQFDNREGAKFRGECEHKYEFACPECGTKNRAGNNFRNECGHVLRKTREIPSIIYSEPQSDTPKFLADIILHVIQKTIDVNSEERNDTITCPTARVLGKGYLNQ